MKEKLVNTVAGRSLAFLCTMAAFMLAAVTPSQAAMPAWYTEITTAFADGLTSTTAVIGLAVGIFVVMLLWKMVRRASNKG